tara:strand:- start:480 stop:752 length:273 start_codon:yes stop_codon:yes gene_type:complete
MKSPALAPSEYDQRYQTELNTLISELDDNMMKLNAVNYLSSRTDSSGDIDQTGAVVIQSPDGTFYKLTVADGGAVSGVAITTGQSSNPYA